MLTSKTTLYQYLSNPDTLRVLVGLIRNGILKDSTLITHIAMFDRFLNLEGSKGERYERLAMEFGMHCKSVQQIILKLKKPTK